MSFFAGAYAQASRLGMTQMGGLRWQARKLPGVRGSETPPVGSLCGAVRIKLLR